MKKIIGVFFSFMLVLTILSGCGGQSVTKQSSNDSLENSKTEESTLTENSHQAFPRTIIDAAGKEIALDARPQRITLLHTFYLEHFLALETPPTGCAIGNILGQSQSLDESELFAPYLKDVEIADLGSSREINLEAVLESNPDVIVVFAGHKGVDTIYDQLNQIAPVIQLDFSATWQEQLNACAEIVGKEAEARNLVSEIEEKISYAKQTVREHSDKSFALFRTNGKDFITRSDAKYYETFGLTMPEGWPEGYVPVSLESVAQMNPYYIVFQHNSAATTAFVESMETSTVWQSLDAVKNGRIYYFDENMNAFGPLAHGMTAEKLVEIYTTE